MAFSPVSPSGWREVGGAYFYVFKISHRAMCWRVVRVFIVIIRIGRFLHFAVFWFIGAGLSEYRFLFCSRTTVIPGTCF